MTIMTKQQTLALQSSKNNIHPLQTTDSSLQRRRTSAHHYELKQTIIHPDHHTH